MSEKLPTPSLSEPTAEAEVWLRAVLASTLDPVIVIDAFGIVRLAGDSVERILGWKPDDLIGRSVNAIIPSPHREKHDDYLARYRETGESLILGTAREFEVLCKDGSLVPCEISISRVDVPGHDLPYFCGIVHDVSKEKAAREESQRLTKSLEDKNAQLESFVFNAEKLASMGKLAASVAHEIRNPLTSLKLRLFSIRKAVGDDPRLQKKFEIVSQEMDRLERVVHNFLEFSRPPALELQSCKVRDLVDKALALFGHRLAQSKVRIDRKVDASLPKVSVDPDQLQQVLVNLLSNSAEALEDGGRIEFSAAAASDDGRDMVVLRLSDDGPGIPPEHAEKIFEPFFSTKPEGTGLGVSISKQIVERHDGMLRLESPGAAPGTTFAIWLPVSK